MLTAIKLTIVLYAAFIILVLIARFAVFCIDGIKSENARIKAKQAAKEASFDRPYEVCPSCGATMKKPRYDPSWVDEAEELSAMLDDDR